MARDMPNDRPKFSPVHDMPMSRRERAAVAKAVRLASRSTRRQRNAVEGLAAIQPRKGMENVPAEQNRVRNARIAWGLTHQKELDAAKKNPVVRDAAHQAERAAFDLPGGGGLLRKVGEDFVNAALYTPAGLYLAGKAVAGDVSSTARGKPTVRRTGGFLGKVAEATGQTAAHPLRHPGDSILLGLGFAGAGAGLASRAGAASEAARVGGARAALTRAGHEGGSLLHRPTPGVRLHGGAGDLRVPGRYSANPAVRAAQRAKDQTVARAAQGEGRVAGAAEAYQIRKAGKELGLNRMVEEARGRAPAHRLARMGRKLTKPQQQALRVWGQGLTIDQKIAAYQRNIADLAESKMPPAAKAKRVDDLNKRIALTEAARGYLDAEGNIASFKAPRGPRGASSQQFAAIGRQAERTAGDVPGGRERALIDAGLLEPEQQSFRLHAPGRLGLGAEWTTAAQNALDKLDAIRGKKQALTPGSKVIPGKRTVTRRPRTRQEAEARLGALDEAITPLVDQIALSLKQADDAAIENLPKKARSRADWIESQHKPKSAETGLPLEDQAAWELENFGTTYQDYLFSKGARQRRTGAEHAADAEEILHQLAGGTPNFEIPLETRVAWADELQAQGIDRAMLKQALEERDALRHKLRDNRSIEDVFGPEPDAGTVTWKQPRDEDGITMISSGDGEYQIAFAHDTAALMDREGRTISTYDSIEEAKAGAQHADDILAGRKPPGPMKRTGTAAGDYGPNQAGHYDNPPRQGPLRWGKPARSEGGMVVHTSKDGAYRIETYKEPGFRGGDKFRTPAHVKLYTSDGELVGAFPDVRSAKAAAERHVERQAPLEAPAPAKPGEDFGEVATVTQEPDRIVAGVLDDEGVKAMQALDAAESQALNQFDRGNEPLLVGQEDFQGGRFRVPDVPEKEPSPTLFGRGSVYRGGEPKPPKSLTRGYTGRLEASGGARINTTAETSRAALEAHKYTSVLDLRKQILKAGVDHRPPDTRLVQWVPVRKQRLTAKQRRQLTQSAPLPESELGLEVTASERAAVAGTQWEQFLEDVFPEKAYAKVAVGERVPNVVWVPRQMLGNMNKPFTRSPWAPGVAVIDTALNLVKFGVIPLKTAYVTANAAGNALFNVFHQGVFMPRNWQQARTLLRDERTGAIAREIMGSGGMPSLLGGNPKGLAALNQVMHGYGNVMSELMLEPMMRVSALVHEARRFGHKSNAQIYRLMTDPKMRAQRDIIVRRAKDAIVDYDRMGPVEKAVFRRGLFIYPWVKGATIYAWQFLLEHPVQSAVYSQVANVGQEQAQKDLGDMPSYARGSFKVGGTEDFPLVVNPSSLSPFSQAAEIAQTALSSATGEGGSADQLGGLLHPSIQAGIEAAYKRDLFTGAPLQGSFPGLLVGRSIEQTAPATLMKNLAKADQPPGRRAFPMTKKQAILRNTIGSFVPRTANRKVLNDSARVEREHDLSPGQRARRKVFRERQQVFETMKRDDPRLLRGGRLPAPVRRAYNRKAEVEATRRLARARARGDSLVYYRTVAVEEARLLEKWGALPKGKAADIARAVQDADLETVKDGLEKMRNDLMPDAYRDVTSAGERYLERRGEG